MIEIISEYCEEILSKLEEILILYEGINDKNPKATRTLGFFIYLGAISNLCLHLYRLSYL